MANAVHDVEEDKINGNLSGRTKVDPALPQCSCTLLVRLCTASTNTQICISKRAPAPSSICPEVQIIQEHFASGPSEMSEIDSAQRTPFEYLQHAFQVASAVEKQPNQAGTRNLMAAKEFRHATR